MPVENSDLEPDVNLLTYIVAVSLVITFIIVLLPIFDAMAVDPKARLIVSFVFLIVLALVMVRLALPKKKNKELETAKPPKETADGGVEMNARMLEAALEGSDYSKYLALKQLKDVAVGRIMLRLHLGREEADALMDDERWLRHVLKDDTLARVVAHDYRGTPHDQRERISLSDVLDSFDVKFPELLKKVEALS